MLQEQSELSGHSRLTVWKSDVRREDSLLEVSHMVESKDHQLGKAPFLPNSGFDFLALLFPLVLQSCTHF